ncbi:MAG: Wzz/FepE/Etk N-terminal domain-containing protein [Steroidobacteraceae bacterium]
MNFHQFVSIMAARWRVALGVFLACVAVSQVISLRSPKLYTAKASMVVDAKDPVAGANQGIQPNLIQTQIEIITSAAVADQVVRDLGLDKDPAMQTGWHKSTGGKGDFKGWLAAGLLNSITVPPPLESNVVNVYATWSDPVWAAKIANAFVEAYIQINIQQKAQPARDANTFFDARSQALKLELDEKRKALSDYMKKEGILVTGDRLDNETTRLNELSSELTSIESQQNESRSRAAQARGNNQSAPEILQSQLVSGLTAEISAKEARAKNLATQLDVNHPERQSLEADIKSLKEQLDREKAKVVDSLRSTSDMNSSRRAAVINQIAEQKRIVADVQRKRDQVTIMQNEVTVAQRTLDGLAGDIAQTSLQSQTSLSNASLLTKATEPFTPSSPKYKMNFAIGLLSGLALAIASILGLEKIDQRVRRDEELPLLLGVPLLTTFRSTQAGPAMSAVVMLKSVASRALGVKDGATKALGWSR